MIRPRVSLPTRFIRRRRRPPNHHQEHIQNEQRNRNVIENSSLMGVRPALVGRPEQKRHCEQDSLQPFLRRRPVNTLIHQVSNRDHRQWKCPQQLMSARRKPLWSRVPHQQRNNARKRHNSEHNRNSPMGAVNAAVHNKRVSQGSCATLRKELRFRTHPVGEPVNRCAKSDNIQAAQSRSEVGQCHLICL